MAVLVRACRPVVLAAGVVVLALLVAGCAGSARRTRVELIGGMVLAQVPTVLGFQVLGPPGPLPAGGTPPYRRVVVFTEEGLPCADSPVSAEGCGVKIETFRTPDQARQRLRDLRSAGVPRPAETDVRSGDLVLRVSDSLAPRVRSRYIAAFRAAATAFP